jgi:tRNA pseudouridine38-40 synthase
VSPEPEKRTLKITIAYDGTRLVGWQRQREGDSVQGLLEDVLAKFEGAPVTVHGAGRTDAGVHALAQVASVRLSAQHPPAVLVPAIHAHLPGDVRVLSIEQVPAAFHARFSSTGKTYRYYLCTDPVSSPFGRLYSWHLPEPMDLAAMERAATALIGTHDFSAFRSAGSDTSSAVRTVHRAMFTPGIAPPSLAEPAAAGGWLGFEIAGDGFLRHMVRAVVGTLVEIGRGWRDGSTMGPLVNGGTRAQAGMTAPPHGLFLVRVDYD